MRYRGRVVAAIFSGRLQSILSSLGAGLNMLHGSLNGFFHKSMAIAAVSIPELTCRWKRNRSGQRGVRIGPYAGVMVAVRSRGQALLWSCYVDLAHGIVWANRDYLLEFAGRSLQTGMPTWRAFTRGAVPGCVTASYAALRDGSVKDVACRAWTNAPSKTKSFTFPM